MNLRPRSGCPLWVRSVVIVLVLFAAASRLGAGTPLRAGEELTYGVRWAFLPGAGQIHIAASHEMVDGGPGLNVTTVTETRGLAKSLLAFHARSESRFEADSGRLLSLQESSLVRTKRKEHALRFDYSGRQASLVTADGTRSLDLPEGDPADLIMTLMKTRQWDLSVGESRDVVVSFRHDFYVLTVHALRLERVTTPLGEFETIVLEPRMEKSPPKGMFKRGGTVCVWVTRDASRLPVRFQVGFNIGTGVATLVKYTPPAAEADSRVVADQ